MLPLQAEYGVSTEYPAGSMTAFLAAAEQHYDSIFLDLEAQNGSFLAKVTDREKYDRTKFSGTAPATLEQILTFAAETGSTFRFGNSFETFAPETQEVFFKMIAPLQSLVTLTANQPETLYMLHNRFPDMPLHYTGTVTKELLSAFSGTQVTIWLDMSLYTPEELTVLAVQAKTFGKLGLSSVREYAQAELAEELGAAIISTPGQVKPVQNAGVLSDMHIHSQNSMDANFPILDIAKSEIESGVGMIAITDHIEMQWVDTWPEYDMEKCLLDCAQEIKEAQEVLGDAIQIGIGMELGQAAWHPEEANRLIKLLPMDIIVGSVHEIMDPTVEDRVAAITPWQKLFKPEFENREELFITQYFKEMLTMVQTMDIDVLAHMTFFARTAHNKFNRHIDLHPYEDSIRQILQVIIDKAIALEINCCWSLEFGTFDPEEWIIDLYREMGGYLITLGSDTHAAEDPIKSGFRETSDKLKAMGFRNTFYFKDRRCYPCAI